MTIIRDIASLLDSAYPLTRAESWDKVGLLIGDASASANRVLVCHELTDATIDEAQNTKANCIVVYHPPLFRPLQNLDFSDHSVRLAARCIAENFAVIALHTALDNAPFGRALGDKLASQLGLINVRVIGASGREDFCKLIVYLPLTDLENVQNALWNAGAGAIGNYDEASFRVRGQGTFRPHENAKPTIGTSGARETVDEWRLEVLVRQSELDACVAAMKAAHSYEEVAHDIIKLENGGATFGACRLGELTTSTRFDDFARDVHRQLNAPNLRVVASKKSEVKTIACIPGSGASYITTAVKSGADALVSGDFKHHDALQAQAHHLALVDVTHAATERAAVEMIAQVLEQTSTRLGFEVVRSTLDTNPFSQVR